MASQPEPAHLLIIGDSASLGAAEVRGSDIVDHVSPSYIDLLRQSLPWLTLTIDAEVHRTTSAVRDELDAILAAHPTRHLLLFLGSNDADLDWRRFVLSDGTIVRNRLTVERYQQNLRVIVEKLQSLGIAPILTAMHNHNLALRGAYISKLAGKDVTAMIARHGGQPESNKHLQLYRTAVATVATEMNVPLIAYGAAMDGRDVAEVLAPDGAHISAGGHRILADLLRPVLEKMFGLRP